MTFDPQKRRLDQLLPQIRSGEIQLPEFQRNYVWKWGQRFHLLNSVQKGYPIGTLLFLETSADSAGSVFKSRLVQGVDETSEAKSASPNELILDGQQRLTTLFQAFNRSGNYWYCLDLKELFKATGGQKNVEVDIEDFVKRQRASKSPQSTLHNKHLLPLFFVVVDEDDRSLVEIIVEYQRTLGPEEKEFGDFLIKNLESYLKPFRDYELPVVRLSKSLSISAIATIFTELNNTGQKLTAFDLCVAKFFPAGINLRLLLDEKVATDSDFARLDPEGTASLQSIALLKNQGAKGLSSKKAKLVETLQPEWVDELWASSTDGISSLGKLFSQTGFGSSKTLPYESVIPSLSVAITLLKQKGKSEASIQTRLRTFILGTGFNARYTEGTDAKRDNDVPEFMSYVSESKIPDHLTEVFNTHSLISSGLSGAKYAAFLGLLNGENLKDFKEDQAVGFGLPYKSNGEVHHIFPKKYLQTFLPATEAKKKADVVLNTTILLPETNNDISDKQPSTYLKLIKKELVAKGHCADDNAADKRLRDTLRAHLIDADGFDCLLKDDFEGFLEARAKALAEKLKSLGVGAEYLVAESSEEDD